LVVISSREDTHPRVREPFAHLSEEGNKKECCALFNKMVIC